MPNVLQRDPARLNERPHREGDRAERRSRICHIIHDDGPGGGPSTVVHHVTYNQNYFDLLVLYGGSGRIAHACAELGIPRQHIALHRKSHLPIGFFQLLCHFRRFRPDLVMLHGQWAAPVGAMAAWLSGIRRIIYICHWPSFYTDWDLRRVIRNYLCEAIPSRLASKVITLSESNHYQYLIRGQVAEGRLLSIPNPIDLEEIPSPEDAMNIRARYGFSDGLCHVVSIGRLSTQKKIDWLLKSWALVIQETSQARLWIVGSGELEFELKGLAEKLRLGDSCVFLGSQPSGMCLAAAADIVAFTSLYEAQGKVALEAMACGKPIVASQVDGLRDSFQDGLEGFFVPPGDVELFAERVVRLINDLPLRQRMGRAGKATAQRFAKPVIMKRYLEVINSVLAEN